MVGSFSHFIATGLYDRIPCFDTHPLPWSSLGTITCPLVQSLQKRLQHANSSELAASEGRQNGHVMVLPMFCPIIWFMRNCADSENRLDVAQNEIWPARLTNALIEK